MSSSTAYKPLPECMKANQHIQQKMYKYLLATIKHGNGKPLFFWVSGDNQEIIGKWMSLDVSTFDFPLPGLPGWLAEWTLQTAPIFTHQSLELCARPQGARWQVSIGCAVEPLMVCCLQSPWPRRWAPTCSLHYRHNLLQTEIAQNTSMIQGSFALTQVSFEVQFWERTFTLESYWLPVWDFAKGASTYHQIIRTWTSNLILTKLILGLWLLSRRVISSMTSWSKGILPGNLKQFDFKKIKKLKDTV